MSIMDIMIEEYKKLWKEKHKLEKELEITEKCFIKLSGAILEELMKQNTDVLKRLKGDS